MVSLLFTSAIIALLVLYIANASDFQGEIVRRPTWKTSISTNKVFTAMSENLDCSLYMKRLSIVRQFMLQGIVRQGIMCISLLVPYSSAGVYSSFSMMSLYIKSPESQIISSIKAAGMTTEEIEANPMQFYSAVYAAMLRLENAELDGTLARVWFESWNAQHMKVWLRHITEYEGEVEELTRSFRIPYQIIDHLYRLNKTDVVREWMKFHKLTEGVDLKKQRLFVTPQMGLRPDAFDGNGSNKSTPCVFINYPIYRRQKLFEVEHVLYPAHLDKHTYTFSMFSAFIISTITKVFNDSSVAFSGPDRDVSFLYIFLRAQQAAFTFLPRTGEFSLFDAQHNSTKANDFLHRYHQQAAEIISRNGFIAPPNVTVNKLHRVTSIAVWSRNRYRDWPITFTMSRLHPFRVPYEGTYGSEDFKHFTRFHHNDNGTVFTSAAFTASAEVIIIKTNRRREHRVTHVITASGSVRTFEAVAMTALRMLLFGEDVDEAVTAKSGFYDVRNGLFFCEDKAMIRLLYEKYKFVCNRVPEDDFEANDRVVMAAHVPEPESELRNHMHSVIHSRVKHRDYNYAVGY